MNVGWVCGIDAGRSATKVVAVSLLPLGKDDDAVRVLSFPNACIPLPNIRDESTNARVTPHLFAVGPKTFVVGELAETLGDPLVATPNGMDNSWFSSTEHHAVVGASLKRMFAQNALFDPSSCLVSIGLPVDAMPGAKSYAAALIQSIKASELKLDLTGKLMITSQAKGPVLDRFCSFNGGPSADAAAEGGVEGLWVIIEIGHFSTDFMVLRAGMSLESEHVSLPGMRVAAELIRDGLKAQGYSGSYLQVRSVLEQGLISVRGKPIDQLALRSSSILPLEAEYRDKLLPLMRPHLESMSGVIVAGGGAQLLRGAIESMLPPGVVSVPENPRFAVARGFAKAGVSREKGSA